MTIRGIRTHFKTLPRSRDRLTRWKSLRASRPWPRFGGPRLDAALQARTGAGLHQLQGWTAFELPMFQGTYLLEAVNRSQGGGVLFHALWNDLLGELFVLDSSNEPIYEAAARFRLKTDLASMQLYVRFFFDAVVGRLGSFLIVETMQDVPWLGSATNADREQVAVLLQPFMTLEHGDSELILEATMLFKNALFRSKVRVYVRQQQVEREEAAQAVGLGELELFDEELLLEGLPIWQTAPDD